MKKSTGDRMKRELRRTKLDLANELLTLRAGLAKAGAGGANAGQQWQYRALVENSPDVIMRLDREGRHMFVSSSVTRVVDMEPGAFIGRTHRELGFPEEQCRMWEDAIRSTADTGQQRQLEFEFYGRAGRVVFDLRLIPEDPGADGARTVIIIARDITAEREMEQNYRMLFEGMLSGYALHEIILDSAGRPVDYRFLSINPAFERLTGLKASRVVGRTVLEVLPDIEREWIETYGRVALTGEPMVFENYAAPLDKYYEVVAFRPAPGRFAVAFQDITKGRRAEEGLKRSLKDKEVLLREVHHRVKNNLAIIASLHSLQEAKVSDPDTARLFRESGARIHSMALVHEMLYSSRDISRIDVKAYVEQLVQNIVHTMLPGGQQGVSIETSVQQGVNLSIDTLIPCGLIISELLTNCIKYAFAPAGRGSASVRLYTSGGSVHLAVRDSGPGMPKDMEPETAHTLGMSIVRSLVNQLEGGMSIRNDHGAEVSVSFREESGGGFV